MSFPPISPARSKSVTPPLTVKNTLNNDTTAQKVAPVAQETLFPSLKTDNSSEYNPNYNLDNPHQNKKIMPRPVEYLTQITKVGDLLRTDPATAEQTSHYTKTTTQRKAAEHNQKRLKEKANLNEKRAFTSVNTNTSNPSPTGHLLR